MHPYTRSRSFGRQPNPSHSRRPPLGTESRRDVGLVASLRGSAGDQELTGRSSFSAETAGRRSALAAPAGSGHHRAPSQECDCTCRSSRLALASRLRAGVPGAPRPGYSDPGGHLPREMVRYPGTELRAAPLRPVPRVVRGIPQKSVGPPTRGGPTSALQAGGGRAALSERGCRHPDARRVHQIVGEDLPGISIARRDRQGRGDPTASLPAECKHHIIARTGAVNRERLPEADRPNSWTDS
jgi:hypothetical protein